MIGADEPPIGARSRTDGSSTRPDWSLLESSAEARDLIDAFGHWDLLHELRGPEARRDARGGYDACPGTPVVFEGWRSERDRVLDEVYESSGADPKY